MSKTTNNETSASQYTVADKQIICLHCGGDQFLEGKGEVNPSGKTFLGMALSSKWVCTLACNTCGRMEWFLKVPQKIDA